MHEGISKGHCTRALPRRLQELLKAGKENPELFTDLASCIETETTDYYDIITSENKRIVLDTSLNMKCVEPHIESLGVSAYDAFLIKKILNGTDEPVTEAKLTAIFSAPKMMKEYNKDLNYGASYEDKLAGLVARIILLLKGFVLTKERDVLFHTIYDSYYLVQYYPKRILVKYWLNRREHFPKYTHIKQESAIMA